MKYIKFYDNFIHEKEVDELIDIDSEKQLTNTTIDDILSDDFFDDKAVEEDQVVKKDNRGVYHITGWKLY